MSYIVSEPKIDTRKFKMELTWHNCLTYPPSESFNPKLFVTDGKGVYIISYSLEKGFYDDYVGRSISKEQLSNLWWADIEQTVQCETMFR